MKNPDLSLLPWSTASYFDARNTTPCELSALGEHLNHCRVADGRSLALHCAAQSLRGFVATRLVTTLLLTIAVAMGCVVLVR